jgi:hypothetical protein
MVYPKVRLISTLPSGHAGRREHNASRLSQRERVMASLMLERGHHPASPRPYVNPNRGIY